jgi:hypothetical protein
VTSAVYNVVNVVVISAVTRFIDAENLSRFFDAHIGSNQKLDRAFWVSIEAEGEVSSPPFTRGIEKTIRQLNRQHIRNVETRRVGR